MTMPPDKAQVLRMLIKLCGTMTAIEWACSTDARSCLKPSRSPATASSWPSMSREYYKLSWPFFDQARVTHKMDFCEDPTLKHLHALLTDEANHSAFDFVFEDADSQTDDSSVLTHQSFCFVSNLLLAGLFFRLKNTIVGVSARIAYFVVFPLHLVKLVVSSPSPSISLLHAGNRSP
jgi:hypothetical protein